MRPKVMIDRVGEFRKNWKYACLPPGFQVGKSQLESQFWEKNTVFVMKEQGSMWWLLSSFYKYPQNHHCAFCFRVSKLPHSPLLPFLGLSPELIDPYRWFYCPFSSYLECYSNIFQALHSLKMFYWEYGAQIYFFPV